MFTILGDLRLVSIAIGQKHLFGVVQVTTNFTVIFVDTGLDNRIDRASLFAKTAKNALGQIDVIARGSA